MKFSVEKMASGPIDQFVMMLLHSVTNAHILHLQTNSYSKHKALEAYYTEIGDLVDSFVEAYQGRYELMTIGYAIYGLPSKDATAYITFLSDEVKRLRYEPEFPQDTELQNLTDEIAQLLDSTLYKLRFLN